MSGGAETAPGLTNDERAVLPGDLRRAVGRPIVDDDGAIAGGQPREHPGQGEFLVETREYDVDGEGGHLHSVGDIDSPPVPKPLRVADHLGWGALFCLIRGDRNYSDVMSSLAAVRPDPLLGRRVLVVDDDATVSEVVCRYLLSAGFIVDSCGDGLDAVALATATRPDLVVLDRMLPGLDGLEVCRRIRADRTVPVIMLTALREQDDRIDGLEVGADDYLAKPFSPRELVLRVQSVLRRTLTEFTPEAILDVGSFRLDISSRQISLHGRELTLTVREFDLLAFLLRHPHQVFGREELLRAVWGWEFGDLSTVTVHVRRLREKIEPDPAHPTLLTTVWGVGYRFNAEPVVAPATEAVRL